MSLVKRNKSLFPGFESMWDDFFDREWFGNVPAVRNFSTPAVNVKETEGAFEVEVAAPGLKKDDFTINLDRKVLTISSKKEEKQEEKDEEGNYTRREFSYRSFARSFTLPELVDEEKITASYEDGVLLITIPKKEEAIAQAARQIDIA
jgi:HSP20 family protein